MPNTVGKNWSEINNSVSGPPVNMVAANSHDVFIITFSDGVQVAITDYDDKEAQDIAWGTPASSGAVDTVNMWMSSINNIGVGATFNVKECSGGVVGSTVLFTFTNSVPFSDAAFAFVYNTTTQNLEISTMLNPAGTGSGVGPIDADGTMTPQPVTSSTNLAVCYLRGTHILTDRGEIRIEDLRPGDLVQTRFGGLTPVKWIGVQRFSGRLVGKRGAPVCFHANSLGNGLPHADLSVSPAHGMLIDGHLVAAANLVNDLTITQTVIPHEIEYLHIDLGHHDCVMAEGVWSESYRENAGNRAHFHNAASFGTTSLTRREQPPCLPCVTEGNDPRLPALRQRATPRLAGAQLSASADVHLRADQQRIELISLGGSRWCAVIPPHTRSLSLMSRATRPSMVGDAEDHRPLGVCVHSLEVRSADGGVQAIALDHPALNTGFHGTERNRASMFRWTNGQGVLPLHALTSINRHEPVLLTIGLRHQAMNFVGVDRTAPQPIDRVA